MVVKRDGLPKMMDNESKKVYHVQKMPDVWIWKVKPFWVVGMGHNYNQIVADDHHIYSFYFCYA